MTTKEKHSAPAAVPATAKADRDSRHAALVLGTTLPGDVLLYLLLPMFASEFGVSLAEVGLLLAANRLVRIIGYSQVVRFYSRYGDRPTSMLAVLTATLCALGYATLSGFWAILPLRLMWGLTFGALNLSTLSMATSLQEGAAARYGRARAYTALGPALALPLGAWLAGYIGPQPIFLVMVAVTLAGLGFAWRLPSAPHPLPQRRGRLRWPEKLDIWSFLEGFVLDGLFVIGLAYLGKALWPEHALLAAGLVMGARYACEILLSPLGGWLAGRFGPERLLVTLALLTCLMLVGFGAGWIWTCASAIVVLRALLMPLLPPIVASRWPGKERVQALTTRAIWRDIGGGTGPVAAGLLLPVLPALTIYGVAAGLLGLAALTCIIQAPRPAGIDR